MSKITFQNQNYEREDNVSVLDTLLNAGLEIPYGCKSGICQSCMMRATEGEVPEDAKKALTEVQQQKNFFLACSCYPENDVSVALPSEADVTKYHVAVVAKEMLNEEVIRLRLSIPDGFSYKAGQFINLIKDDVTQRSYSLASVPGIDNFLELQIKVLKNGCVSSWIENDLEVGAEVAISEAHGECYYSAGESNEPILLVGTGTGLAPLYGVIRDALQQQHSGDIILYHGASQSSELYLKLELIQLELEHKNFTYIPCVSRGEISDNEISGRANDIAMEKHPDLKGWKVYLCGNPNMVDATRRKAFLAGANFKDIFIDAFKFASS